MYSILVTKRNVLARNFNFPIPWRYDSNAYNMLNESPTRTINITKSGWKSRLLRISDKAVAIFIDADLTEYEYIEMINIIPNIKSLYAFTGTKLDNIKFVEKLKLLENIMICHSKIKDLEPLKRLVTVQEKENGKKYLKRVAIIDSNVADVSNISNLLMDEFVMDNTIINKNDESYVKIMRRTYLDDEWKFSAT